MLKLQNSNNSKTPIKRTFDTIDSFLAIVSIFAIVSLDLCVMIMDIGKNERLRVH